MIALNHVSKCYGQGDQEVAVLHDVNLTVPQGQYLALTGSSGSGKSTLMNIIGCLDVPTYGDYFLDGRSVTGLADDELSLLRSRCIGFVFQSFYLMPRQTVLQNVAHPLVYQGIDSRTRSEQALSALALLGVAELAERRPNQLSGGQRQRVAIARAIAAKPRVILADEPTGNLDSQTAADVVGTLESLCDEGLTVMVVTHDEAIARRCERVIRLKDGKVVEDVCSSSVRDD